MLVVRKTNLPVAMGLLGKNLNALAANEIDLWITMTITELLASAGTQMSRQRTGTVMGARTVDLELITLTITRSANVGGRLRLCARARLVEGNILVREGRKLKMTLLPGSKAKTLEQRMKQLRLRLTRIL